MIDRYEIEFTQWAETDLDHIVMYIAENDSVSRAVEVYLKIKEKIFSLEALADRGRVVPELKRIRVMEYKELIHSPYRIIYRVEHKTVFIVAVFDGRRQLDDIIYQRVIGVCL